MSDPPRIPITLGPPLSTSVLFDGNHLRCHADPLQVGLSPFQQAHHFSGGHHQTPPQSSEVSYEQILSSNYCPPPSPRNLFPIAPSSQTSSHHSQPFGRRVGPPSSEIFAHPHFEPSIDYSIHNYVQADQLHDDLRVKIHRLLARLETIPSAYTFVDASHPFMTGPELTYLETAKNLPNTIKAALCLGLFNALPIIEAATFSLPTYAQMLEMEAFKDRKFGYNGGKLIDQPAVMIEDMKNIREDIRFVARQIEHQLISPTPSSFAHSRNWHRRQLNDEFAILCHKPAHRRAKVPIKLKHDAFFVFFKVLHHGSLTVDELEEVRVAAERLGNELNSMPEDQKEWVEAIEPIFQRILPDTQERKWTSQARMPGGRAFCDLLYGVHGGDAEITPLIMISFRVDPGGNGDGYMRLCRLYDIYVRGNSIISQSAAPCFLISISGHDIKICGGLTEVNPIQVEVDRFMTVSASLDLAVDHREQLARALLALKEGVKHLPRTHLCGVPDRIPSVPVVFDKFLDKDGIAHRLAFGKPFNERKCSIYYTADPPDCMVKLTFRPYGSDVHNILYKHNFAPELLGTSNIPALNAMATVMARLPSPTMDADGWVTLYDLFSAFPKLVRDNQNDIYEKLEQMVGVLKKFQVVHGDLRANNLMIKVTCGAVAIVKPVEVNAVDMEWSGKVKFAYYPADRNEKVGYPGRAGGLIESEDDMAMIKIWKRGINGHSNH